MAKFSFYRSTPPIALLTDFGFKDNYVGVMKGVICNICPDADVIDLSHNIMPQDVTEAAFVLSSAYRYFPEETIFVNVVDPGVGSARSILCLKANEQLFLAPDNGLLSVISNETDREALHEVTNKEFFLENVSGTFHGRDIFAPVAAHLAAGVDLEDVGPALDHMQRLQLPRPVRTAEGKLRGKIVYVDHFGNLITNISENMIRTAFNCPLEAIEVTAKRQKVRGIRRSYSAVDEGELVVLIGSTGYLEIAINGDSAEKALGAEKGDSVNLSSLKAVPEG